MNPVFARLLNQQLISPLFTAPYEVVRWMGAMQGQDYRMMRWAVGMRTRKPSARAFEQDFNSGRIVRVHLFRTTWQLVAGEDLRWMLGLCRTHALRGLAGWMKSNGVSIPRTEQETVQTLFADFLSSHRTATKSDFDAALRDKGIVMDDHRLSYHIRLGEYAGLLCSGDLLPQKATYALVTDKLPGSASRSREESLALLARTYFRSHAPATLEDFVWWSGLGIGDCRKGIDALGPELSRERWKGLSLYLHEDCRTRGFRRGGVLLLSPYDEYLIGYKSRHVAVHPDHSHRAHNNTGNFWPVVLQDGEVVGNWSFAGGRVQVDVFHPDACLDPEALQRQLRKYELFARPLG
ncbi:MAG: AlkZ family DNA glycosylase [Bacteroidales bacterium]|nr:AlkZ family DNA glycosylase [Bacteroidales bacterium]